MKLITWNVNSVRARLPRLLALLERHQPDVLCLQELKCVDDAFPAAEVQAAGYHAATYGQKTYNGVAILTRSPLQDVRQGFPGDPAAHQARVISGTIDSVRVINAYVVNGKALDSEHYQTKLAWLDALTAWLRDQHDPAAPLVLTGDFNVAPDERDVWDVERYTDHIHFSLPERRRVQALLDWGLADLLRTQTEEGGIFTWWDYRAGSFPRGRGLRLDLVLGTAPVARGCSGMSVDRDERKKSSGEGNASDHAPVIAEFAL